MKSTVKLGVDINLYWGVRGSLFVGCFWAYSIEEFLYLFRANAFNQGAYRVCVSLSSVGLRRGGGDGRVVG